jgi:hypothetical protein
MSEEEKESIKTELDKIFEDRISVVKGHIHTTMYPLIGFLFVVVGFVFLSYRLQMMADISFCLACPLIIVPFVLRSLKVYKTHKRKRDLLVILESEWKSRTADCFRENFFPSKS